MFVKSTPAAGRRPRRRAISAVLFIFPLVDLIAEYLLDLFGPGNLRVPISSLPPHPLFHVLTPSAGFLAATAILGFSIAFGPYLRGEGWAWWALLLANVAVILANVWGALTIYVHSI